MAEPPAPSGRSPQGSRGEPSVRICRRWRALRPCGSAAIRASA